ncbi:transposase [Streptomyces sp. NBC_00161]|uniref:transposase n=1 Tax=Streptomyces sp. NBC_00161 TaxID=2975671 RepID=UPI0032520758
MAGGDLGGGKRARAACGGYVCFEDEAGFTRRPPRGRTWGRRGITPVVTVSGRRSGRLSVAGLIAMRPGSRTRLCYRLRTHPAGRGTRRSMSERDFIELIDGTHHLVRAPIVLVWDRLNTHVSRRMRELVAEREWLTVFAAVTTCGAGARSRGGPPTTIPDHSTARYTPAAQPNLQVRQ